jgi:hypothetical protein
MKRIHAVLHTDATNKRQQTKLTGVLHSNLFHNKHHDDQFLTLASLWFAVAYASFNCSYKLCMQQRAVQHRYAGSSNRIDKKFICIGVTWPLAPVYQR